MSKNTKNTKKKSKWWLWILLVLLLLFSGFFLLGGSMFGIGFQSQTQLPINEGITPTGGSSGGSNEEPTDTDFSWLSFPDINMPQIEWPCFWNCDNTDTTDETEDDVIYATDSACKGDDDCAAGYYCNIGNMAIGSCVLIPTYNCFDSDKNLANRDTSVYEIQGTCDDTGFLDREDYTDYCSRGELVEYFCRTATACDSIKINCAEETGNPDAICYDGMCTWIA